MNPNLENSNYAFLFATSFLPAILGLVVLIAGLSATMSSASSDAIAAVVIMMRDVSHHDYRQNAAGGQRPLPHAGC